MLGRVQIQAHHILQLVLEVWILAELEGPDSVGVQPMGSPDPLHERRIRPQMPSQGAGRPVSGSGRGRLGRRLQDTCDQRVARLGRTPAAGHILDEAGQALSNDAVPPQAHGLPTRVQGVGDVLVIVAFGRQQGNFGAEYESHRRPPAASPLRQLLAFGRCQLQGRGDAHGQVLFRVRSIPVRYNK